MILQGDGFATEEGVVPDYWGSTPNGLSSVRVYCDNGRQLYRGDGWALSGKSIGIIGPSPTDGHHHHAILGTNRLTAQ